MTVRTVTGTILRPDGTPFVGKSAAIFCMQNDINSGGIFYPSDNIPVVTDATGAFSVDLAVPDTESVIYRVLFANGNMVFFNLGVGAPIDLLAALALPLPIFGVGSFMISRQGEKMTVRDKAALKGCFNVGNYPSQMNFDDLIDTLFEMGQKEAIVPWYLTGILAGINYVAIYQAIGPEVFSETVARINLVNPGINNLTDIGTPTGSWDAASGFVNRLLTTGFVATTTMGAMIRFANAPASDNAYIFGSIEANKKFSGIGNRTGSKFTVHYQNFSSSADDEAEAGGTIGINGRVPYLNGVPYAAPLTAFASDGTKNLFLGCANNGSDVPTPGVGTAQMDILIACFWSGTLTDPQMVALDAAMNAIVPWYLMGGIARNTCIAVYQPKGAISLPSSYINLVNPGIYDVSPGIAPTFDPTTGWIFNGVDQYLDTGLYPEPYWSAIVKYESLDPSLDGQYLLFSWDTILSKAFGFKVGTIAQSLTFACGGTSTFSPVGANIAGVLALANRRCFYNGNYIDTIYGTWPGPPYTTLNTLYIGALNKNGSIFAGSYAHVHVCALAIYNKLLSDAQILAVTNAMNLL